MQRVRGEEARNEPDGERVLRRDLLRKEEQLACARSADDPNERPGQAHVAGHTDFEEACREPSAVGREPEVTRARPPQRRAGAAAVDRRHRDLRHRVQERRRVVCGTHPLERRRAGRGGVTGQVGADREVVARAAQHDDARVARGQRA